MQWPENLLHNFIIVGEPQSRQIPKKQLRSNDLSEVFEWVREENAGNFTPDKPLLKF